MSEHRKKGNPFIRIGDLIFMRKSTDDVVIEGKVTVGQPTLNASYTITSAGNIFSESHVYARYGFKGVSNSGLLQIDIPVYTPDALNHVVGLAIDGNNVFSVEGDGDGSGGVTNLKSVAHEPICLEKGLCKNRVAVAAASYLSLITDCIIGVTYTPTGAVTVTLPSAGALIEGHYVTIIDEGGNANINNITIATEGAETISGAATQTISTAYGRFRIYATGANWFLN